MGRLEEIVERNKNPRKHRQGKFPFGIAVSALVLLILVLMIFTDLAKPNIKPEPAPAPEEKGRVHDIGIYVEHARRDADAGVVTGD